MKKIEFILALGEKLSELPKNEVNEHLSFYSEMIEDRIEEGLSEEDAVAAVGKIEEIAAGILADSPTSSKEGVKKPKRQLKGWEITLLAIGSPIWFSLLVAVASVCFSLYAVLWAVVVSVWAVFVACAGGVIIGLAAGIGYIFNGGYVSGLVLVCCAFAAAGIAIFAFFGGLAITKGAVWLTKSSINGIRRIFTKKEEA